MRETCSAHKTDQKRTQIINRKYYNSKHRWEDNIKHILRKYDVVWNGLPWLRTENIGVFLCTPF